MPPVPFLTPPTTSVERQCRTLRTPTNKEWLGVFNSALLELTNPYNWQQINPTDLTVDDAIALVQEILSEFFTPQDCCDGDQCLLPTGNFVMRLGVGGHFEWLKDGAWTPPSGDYAVPPVPEREEPTAYDRRCAAAANAEYVLRTLYETVTDAVAADLDEAEIIALMIALLASAIGLWLAPLTEPIIWLTYALFLAFLEIAEFMTADLWDEDFSTLLKCLLLDCATDEGDVITFDFACVNENLASTVDLTGIDALTQLRLFGQISFMLSIIGADGLNAAGATTAIEDANCDDCGGWCYQWDLTETDADFEHIDGFGTGHWTSGVGWVGDVQGGTVRLRLIKNLPADINITGMHILFDMTPCGGSPAGGTNLKVDGSYVSGAFTTSPSYSGTDLAGDWEGDVTADQITWEMRTGVTGNCGTVIAKRLVLTGGGDNPFGDDNCE